MIPTWTCKTWIGIANLIILIQVRTLLVVVLIQTLTLSRSQMMMALDPSEPALESVLQLYFVYGSNELIWWNFGEAASDHRDQTWKSLVRMFTIIVHHHPPTHLIIVSIDIGNHN
jgi:hypothetical protein